MLRFKIYEDCEMCEGEGIDLSTECEEFPDTCEHCEGKGWCHFHWSDDKYYDYPE